MSVAPDGLPPLREVIARHGLAARKSLGQNFLLDLNLTGRIARAAGPLDGVTVVEVGPGPGGLTRALLTEGADKVIAVERDDRAIAALAEVQERYPGRLEVIAGDALATDLKPNTGGPVRIVANLPYNIATPLVCDLLDGEPRIARMLVMVQREVAERLCAAVGTPPYGAVSVKVAYWATARIVGTVPASVFVPRPRVESALADIRRRRTPAVDVAPDALFGLVRTAFGQRRKMLRRSLDGLVTPAAFDAAGVDPTDRPEDLDVEAWGRLARAVVEAA